MKKTIALFLCLAVFTLSAGVGLAESSPLLYEVKDEPYTVYFTAER